MNVSPQLTLNPRAPIPLYWQVVHALRRMIEDGLLPDATMLAAEADLAAEWAVSRDTIRKAFDQLTREGLLRRRRGSGTAVVTPVGCRAWLADRDLASHLPAVHNARTAVTLRSGLAYPADPAIALRLDVASNDLALEVVTLTFESERPAAVDYLWRPREFADEEDVPAADRTFHRLLRRLVESGRQAQDLELDEVVRIERLPADAAVALRVPEDQFGLLVERQLKTGGRVIEVRRTYTPAAGTEMRRSVRTSIGEPE